MCLVCKKYDASNPGPIYPHALDHILPVRVGFSGKSLSEYRPAYIADLHLHIS